MKEIDPVVAALADKLWRSPEVPPALPGQEDALVQALALNRKRSGESSWQPPGMMVGPSWLGLNFPLADAISPMGAQMVQGLLGSDGVGQFLPGLGDAMDANAALGYAGDAVRSGLSGDWNDMGQNASWAAVAAMGALPGMDAPRISDDVADAALRAARDADAGPMAAYSADLEPLGYGYLRLSGKEALASFDNMPPDVRSAAEAGADVVETLGRHGGQAKYYVADAAPTLADFTRARLADEGFPDASFGFRTLDDVANSPQTKAKLAAVEAAAKKLGWKIDSGASYGQRGSQYVYLVGPQGQMKIRISDHPNQSALRDSADINIAPGASSLLNGLAELVRRSK